MSLMGSLDRTRERFGATLGAGPARGPTSVESCQICSCKLQMHQFLQSEISNMGVPNNVRRRSNCVADGKWFDVAAGLLPEGETSELLKHAAQCGYCGPRLKRAAETLNDEVTPSEETLLASLSSAGSDWRRNMARTLGEGMRLLRPPSVQELLAQENAEYRTGVNPKNETAS